MTRSPVAPQERLLGFDARKMWLDAEAHWSAERRIRFLLRNDSCPILSTDEFVWPSVFTTGQWPVAGSLVSGLSNCGFMPEEQSFAAERWSHLNRHHLLDSASAADQFRQYTDARVPEHAPFWVYGLFLIEEVR